MAAPNRRRETDWARVTRVIGVTLACVGCLIVVVSAALGWDVSASGRRSLTRAAVLLCAVGVGSLLTLVRRARRGQDDAPRNGQAEAGRTPQEKSAGANLEGMLRNSGDVIATLRDIAAHGAQHGGFRELPDLLERAGLTSWQDAPRLTASRLRRNGQWWLSCADGVPEGEAYDRLVSVEAALNVSEDLLAAGAPEDPAAGQGSSRRVERVFSSVADIEPLTPPSADAARELLMDAGSQDGEWRCRIGFADRCENLPAPFRVEVDFQSNVAAGILCASVSVPGPQCFSLLTEGEVARADGARSYALRLGLLVGRCGLDSLPEPGRVVVNCHEHGRDDATLLSLSLTRGQLDRLRTLVRGRGALLGTLPADECLRYQVGPDGWLGPVEPFARLSDAALCPPARYREVELDGAPAGEALRAACGTTRVSDLGIMEKAGRIAAWNGMVTELGESTQEVVSKLLDLRGATNDLTVAEACERTSKSLVEGGVDASDRRTLASLFVDGGALAQAARHASELFDKDEPSTEELEETLGQLENVLSPITEMGIYLDDSAYVYRYFNSVAERVHYNRAADDGGRRVQLVPDEYYAAHASAARILNALGRSDEALAHADELMRVAPVTPDAALSKVRCLEELSRIFEAADLLKGAIGYASTARDLSICFYRLAFMEWKLGREDLCVACYQRAISLHPDIAPQAKSELADLLSANGSLHALADEEVVPALEQGGLPTGKVGELRLEMRDALVATTDAELFGVAHQLASALIEFCRDDALIDVRRSLARPRA